MKRLLIVLSAMVFLLPSVAAADFTLLSDEEMDGIHAAGLQVFIDINLFLPVGLDNTNLQGVLENLNDPQVLNIAATEVFTEQNVGAGNTGNVLQNTVFLSGSAQESLSALININAANSVIPFGINITVINGDNLGSVVQDNLLLGLMNSSLILGF